MVLSPASQLGWRVLQTSPGPGMELDEEYADLSVSYVNTELSMAFWVHLCVPFPLKADFFVLYSKIAQVYL